jgi:outer membrane protein assembly factor BamA
MNALLVRSSRLAPGTRFTSTSITQAETEMRKALAQNGFHEPSFSHKLTPHPKDQLVDIAYEVASGTQARTGSVAVAGNSGMTPDEFRRYSKLKPAPSVVL